MPKGRRKPIGSFYDLIAMVLDRGITIKEGGRTVTFALANGAPPQGRQVAKPELPAAAPAALPPVKRRPGRPKRTAPKAAMASPTAPAARRGRKALAKPSVALPDSHDVMLALDQNKATGLKLSVLAKQFSISRPLMKRALAPLLASKRAELYRPTQSYIPLTKVRKGRKASGTRSTPKRGKPVSAEAILEVLRSGDGPMDRAAIAKQLDVSYHKLIRRMDALIEAGQIKQSGNEFAPV